MGALDTFGPCLLPVMHVFKIKTPKPESSYFIQKSMTRDPDRQIKCSLRIVPLGHRLGFIADNLTPYTLSLSPLGLLFYEMHFHQGNFYERADVKYGSTGCEVFKQELQN